MNESGVFESLIVRTIECLNETTIEYCIVGAIAASYYGSVRSTEDLDVLINLTTTDVKQIKHLATSLQAKEIDLIEKDLVLGLKEKVHITAFDTRTYFYRIDFKGIYSLLDKETMNTKVLVTILDDLDVWLTPPELQIIAKLLPGMSSEKDILDVKNILLNYKENLNVKLLDKLAQKFNVEKNLDRLL